MIRRTSRIVAAAVLLAAGLVGVVQQPAAAASWQAVPVPLGEYRKISSARIQVFGPDSALMYAGTEPQICFECTVRKQIFQWNGTAWTELVVPPNAAGATPSYAGSSPSDQWSFAATGNDYTFSAYHWNGSAWTDRSAPGVKFQTDAVHVVAPDDVWVAGRDRTGGGFYAAAGHWDGAAWTFARLPEASKTNSPEAVRRISDTEVWVVGTAYPAVNTFRMNAARFDGQTWTTVPMPDGAGRASVVNGAPGDLWITGTKLTGGTGPMCGITLRSTGGDFTRTDICGDPAGTDGGVWRTDVVKYGADWYAALQPRWSSDKIPGGALRRWTGSAWQGIAGPFPTTTNVEALEPIPGGGLWMVAEGRDAAGKLSLTGPQVFRVTGALG
ncbi:hypothetical protein FHR83_001055 [Actinoplanes campanulatus]|uniref:Uncharacterized protein n=1 Tax=Actinoplanes campanulatus TaxID=113559 RepID=A0A7W5ABV3_9ACTN|nr:hypothetical protein [Actinoplanes campanulatus]MBB3093421.1 hypothetical protein [Actinoplanes campanulatus]